MHSPHRLPRTPSLSYIHSHTFPLTHPLRYTPSHTRSLTQLSFSPTLSPFPFTEFSHRFTPSHTYTCAYSFTYIVTHLISHTFSNRLSHSHTHTHTQSHTYILSLSSYPRFSRICNFRDATVLQLHVTLPAHTQVTQTVPSPGHEE